MRYAVLRTHGGLGNQLFQVLFGRLLAEQAILTLKEVHDVRYRHAFSRSSELDRALEPSLSQRFVSSLRLPKLLERLTQRPVSGLKIGGTLYLDAYFQSVDAYHGFPIEMVARHLDKLASELRIGPADLNETLVHLRLGDFFNDRSQAKQHVIERLEKVPAGSYVMTNDELLLQEQDIATLMSRRTLTLVSTQRKSAEDILRTMARYRIINANDSTLTFWSSVLGGGEVTLYDSRLVSCREHLIRCRNRGVS